jgi:hypothetical protein
MWLGGLGTQEAYICECWAGLSGPQILLGILEGGMGKNPKPEVGP